MNPNALLLGALIFGIVGAIFDNQHLFITALLLLVLGFSHLKI